MISRVALICALALAPAAPAAAAVAPGGPAPSARETCAPGSVRSLGSSTTAFAATVERPTRAFKRPGHSPIARFPLVNVNGVAMVLGVLHERVDGGCRPTWLHVALPMRPNGITGWVLAKNVRETAVHSRITVDLSERRVLAYTDGRLVLSSPAAVGSSATPTPVGSFYVNQRLVPSDPGGPFGPGALGISAFSPVLTGWTQGGPIAIHGTNEPWSVGRAVSNGCVRVPNPVLRRLWTLAPTGTPVLIRR